MLTAQLSLRGVLLVALLVAVAGVSEMAIHLNDMSSQYYSGHSAPIVAFGQNPTARDAHAVILDSQHLFGSVSTSSLPLTSYSHVLAHALGLSEFAGVKSIAGESMITKATSSPSKQPRAQILFNLESVGKTTLDRFNLNALANPATPHVSLSLSTPALTPPAESISVAASFATGSSASQHGVIGNKWKDATGKPQTAFNAHKPMETFSQTQTMADHVAAHTDGQGVTLSFSSSESLAWAFAVNKKLADTHVIDGWTNNYCLTLTDGATKIRAVSSNTIPALNFPVSDLQKSLTSASNSLFNNMGNELKGLKIAEHQISFSYSPSKISQVIEKVEFNLKEKSDVAFLSELQYVLDLPSKIKSIRSLQEKFNDQHQDLIVISFAGLTGLLEKYGRESEQFKGALYLINHVFPLISSEFSSIFHAEQTPTLQSIIMLGSHQTVLEKQDPRPVEAALRANGVSDLSYYPNLYIPTDQVLVECEKLNKILAPLKFTAYCPSVQNLHAAHTHMLVESHSEAAHTDSLASLVTPSGQSKFGGITKKDQPVPQGFYVPKPADVQRYQIILWLSIILACVLFTAVYALANMSFKKDTMLYSSFNPNWEDRKRR